MKLAQTHFVRIFLTLLLLVVGTIVLTPTSYAQPDFSDVQKQDGCDSVGQCVNNNVCGLFFDNDGNRILGLTGAACGSSSVGSVPAPVGVRGKNILAGGGSGDAIGIILFLSNLIRVFAIVAGIWAMLNFVLAGYSLISNPGESGALEKAKEQATMSAIGLSLIAGAFIIAGLIGLFMFGDASYILNPQLKGAV